MISQGVAGKTRRLRPWSRRSAPESGSFSPIGFGVAVAPLLVACLVGCQDPPESTLRAAEQSLREAQKARAREFAPASYRRAAALTEEGRMELARQKGRLSLLRDFAAADSLLRLASRASARAREQAQKSRDSVRRLVDAQVRELAGESGNLKKALGASLVRNRLSGHLLKAELHLITAEKCASDERFGQAERELAAVRKALGSVITGMTESADDQANKLSVWRGWVKETVEASKKSGGYAVIVDKSKHATYLIKGGRVVHTYDSDLGFNASRQKLFAGDAATPEGTYRVIRVKKTGSRYYKALLLDYPNARDRQRFRENRRRGVVSADAKIGGDIEIHGEGGRDVDWTEGCVALSNSDMDHLMRFAGEGTPVTIVRTSDEWP